MFKDLSLFVITTLRGAWLPRIQTIIATVREHIGSKQAAQ